MSVSSPPGLAPDGIGGIGKDAGSLELRAGFGIGPYLLDIGSRGSDLAVIALGLAVVEDLELVVNFELVREPP